MIESLNRFLYDTKPTVLRLLRLISISLTTITIGLIIYIIGFPNDDVNMAGMQIAMGIIFQTFAISYFVKLLYSFERINFIKDTRNV